MRTPEEIKSHEDGIRLMNQATGTIFSYSPLPDGHDCKCSQCYEPAEHREFMSTDSQYIDFLCTPCRDKAIWKRFKKMQEKKAPDSRNYGISAVQHVTTAQKKKIAYLKRRGRL